MSKDVDDAASQLSSVAAEASLDMVPVVAVDEGAETVDVTLELPSGKLFTQSFAKPPVWGANCDLKRLLDGTGIEPDDVDDLVGDRLPCQRSIDDEGLSFSIDLESL